MNIAPSQQIACILRPEVGAPRQLSLFRWGLVPSWAKDPRIGNRMINARSETAADKPSFRTAIRSRRCVIPADGYYEWKQTEHGKQPYEYSRTDGRLLALAGLWECNTSVLEDGQPLYSCTILTTAANAFAAEDHDRMPVILSEEELDAWLDPGMRDGDRIGRMLHPAAEDFLSKRPVSQEINKC